MTIYPNLILDALRTVRYPGTGRDIVNMGMVNDDIRIDGNRVSLSLTFDKPTDPFIKSVVKAAEAAILAHVGNEVDIKTHYEMQWLQRGLTIKYIRFALPHGVELVEPDIDIEPDTYRSYNRGYIQMPQLMKEGSKTNN